jgi:excisionase family DNA binding protein
LPDQLIESIKRTAEIIGQPDPLLCDIEETASLIGLGRTKTYELIASGKIFSVRIGRRRLVPRTAIDAYVTDLVEQAAS